MTTKGKVDTEYLKYFWPMRHYLLTCGRIRSANIVAVSFCMPVSGEPPMAACAIGRKMYSAEIIEEAGEFVVNVPGRELDDEVYYCGGHSGRDVDKFAATGLTPLPARHLDAPIIAECLAHMECRVVQTVKAGEKTLFVAEVLDAYADADLEQGAGTAEFALGDFPEHVYGGRFGPAEG